MRQIDELIEREGFNFYDVLMYQKRIRFMDCIRPAVRGSAV